VRTISYSEYYDKVYAGWIGKCIGGNIGAAVENNKYLMDLKESEVFPDDIPPNDDLDLQLLWLQVLETKGVHLTSGDLAEAWEKHCWYPFNEYGYFLHNFERGIEPPTSGWYNNQFFRRSMGCPIRSEIWGMTAIGNPELAMEYAYKDGTLDHDTESVWAEQLLAAMEAEAFFESDLEKLLDFGLTRIPEGSELAACIEFVRANYRDGVDWCAARAAMLARFGDPDASKAVQNLGLTILALLYGEKDFGATQLIALNSGYDTDCTCATAGAILGLIGGTAAIPDRWRATAKDTFVVGINVRRPTDRISDLATDTCRVGVAMSRSINPNIRIEGAPADLGSDRIPVEPPKAGIDISADYLGNPELIPGETKEMMFILSHRGEFGEAEGMLRIESPERCTVSPNAFELRIMAGESLTLPVRVRFEDEVSRMSSSVKLRAVWTDAKSAERKEKIVGLAAGQPFRVIGPFWDLYDTTVPGAKSYYDPKERRLARPRGPEHFNNFVSLDREYIEESAGFADVQGGALRFWAEHKLPIDDWMGTKGPACLYLVQDLDIAEEREVRIMIGNNDGFRLWLNGEIVGESREPWYWMPYNHDFAVRLRKGFNRIVVKVIRRGGGCDFSLGYAIPNTSLRWVDDLHAIVPAELVRKRANR